ncbi:hypothetical protein [Tranquillimonas rosea]|uniref:hypothetical protein n=1 Tax=Tranquillimonas rosea TaxID=641238 RepID=UPI003BAC6F83
MSVEGGDARGARSVASFDSLPKDEAMFIRYLRLWCAGADEQSEVWNDIAARLGPARGRQALSTFEDLVGLVLRHARRPIMLHGLTCSCVGADEAVLAHLVTLATSGEREDAMLIATLLVRADVSPLVTSLAQSFGLALHRGRTVSADIASAPPRGRTLH